MEKRKRGRPKGSLDEKKLKIKRPRGNPNWGNNKNFSPTMVQKFVPDVIPIKKPSFHDTLSKYAESLAVAAEEAQRAAEDAVKEEINKRENSIFDTKFQRGNQSSIGRPKGSKNKSTMVLDLIGQENAPAIYNKMVELALSGDINACKFILERVYPVQKYRKISLDFDGHTETIQDINALSNHVLKLAIDGDISFDEAEECGRILEQRMKSITDTDVMFKIEETYQKVDMIKNGR